MNKVKKIYSSKCMSKDFLWEISFHNYLKQ